jgi:hypothetical protein
MEFLDLVNDVPRPQGAGFEAILAGTVPLRSGREEPTCGPISLRTSEMHGYY